MSQDFFNLPYLAVRSKTIDNFRGQQIILARQASTEFQNYFSTYEKALIYLSQQPSIQKLDESGKTLLRDFYSMHPEDLNGILSLNPDGRPLFNYPEINAAETTIDHCPEMRYQSYAEIRELHFSEQTPLALAFVAPIVSADHFFRLSRLFLPL